MLTTADATPTTQMPARQEQHRAFTADVELHTRSDGRRTVEGLVVPYLTPVEINEVRKGQVLTYSEQFAPGSMARAAAAPNRVMLQIEHDERLERLAGYGLSFRDSDAGCVGEFVLHPSMADRTVELLESSHRGLSVTFTSIQPVYGTERHGELVTRSAVACRAVAAVPDPAYADAGVLALRSQQEAAAAAQAEAQRQVGEMASTLRFLRDSGQDLSPVQLRWLEANHVDLEQIRA